MHPREGARKSGEWAASRHPRSVQSPRSVLRIGAPMAQRLHLPHRRMPTPAHSGERPGLGARVYAVQRTGAIIVALFLLVFGLLGFASGQAFFSTRGSSVLGMSSNGLLSTLSVVVGVVLLAAAVRSPHTASTVMLV